MSYCRFSTDDFQCDFYIYECVTDQWMIHVAGRKVVYKEPLPEPVKLDAESEESWKAWFDRKKKVDEIRERSELVAIGLPYDGQTIAVDSPGECADAVEMLLALGYRAPKRIVEDLRGEQKELDDEWRKKSDSAEFDEGASQRCEKERAGRCT